MSFKCEVCNETYTQYQVHTRGVANEEPARPITVVTKVRQREDTSWEIAEEKRVCKFCQPKMPNVVVPKKIKVEKEKKTDEYENNDWEDSYAA